MSKVLRDSQIDWTRGLILIAIVFSHIGYNSAWLEGIARPVVVVDFTGVFFLISGVVFGLQSKKKFGWRDFAGTHRRIVHLYIWQIVIVTFAFILVRIAPNFQDIQQISSDNSMLQLFVGVLTMTIQPRYLDILPIYIGFILLAPGFTWLSRKTFIWVPVALSISLYVCSGIYEFPRLVQQGGGFSIYRWQVIFS